jgi:hypothetical protein
MGAGAPAEGQAVGESASDAAEFKPAVGENAPHAALSLPAAGERAADAALSARAAAERAPNAALLARAAADRAPNAAVSESAAGESPAEAAAIFGRAAPARATPPLPKPRPRNVVIVAPIATHTSAHEPEELARKLRAEGWIVSDIPLEVWLPASSETRKPASAVRATAPADPPKARARQREGAKPQPSARTARASVQPAPVQPNPSAKPDRWAAPPPSDSGLPLPPELLPSSSAPP